MDSNEDGFVVRTAFVSLPLSCILSLYRYVLIDMYKIFDYTASASSLREVELLRTFRNMNHAL